MMRFHLEIILWRTYSRPNFTCQDSEGDGNGGCFYFVLQRYKQHQKLRLVDNCSTRSAM